jgi:DNA-binding MarR family transcriptional regulator
MSSSGEKGEPDACSILANLWQLIQSVMDESEPALGALGLSPKAFFLLEEVGDHPFPAELARRMHLPPPTVTYLVKQLEALGFVERSSEARRPSEAFSTSDCGDSPRKRSPRSTA